MNAKSFLAIALTASLTVQAQDPVDPYKKGGAEPPELILDQVTSNLLSIREETFSLPIAAAYDLMHSTKLDAELYAKLVEQMRAGKARIERLIVLRTKSGQRAVLESINELRYPTEYNPRNATLPVGPIAKTPDQGMVPRDQVYSTNFDTRNVGDQLEIEPVLGPDGRTIDLNLVPQSVRFAGFRTTTDDGSDKQPQPLFETQKVTTSITVLAGEPTLLGTLNAPFGNGLAIEVKEQRVWLDFFTVDVVVTPRVPVQTKALELAKSMTLAKLDFREASVVEAIEFLRAKSVELDPAKQGINFVIKVPPSLADARITLSLKNVPLADVVKYITKMAGLDFTAQENALVIHGPGERY